MPDMGGPSTAAPDRRRPHTERWSLGELGHVSQSARSERANALATVRCESLKNHPRDAWVERKRLHHLQVRIVNQGQHRRKGAVSTRSNRAPHLVIAVTRQVNEFHAWRPRIRRLG